MAICIVSSCKYLGTVVDSKLSFNDNVIYVYKIAEQRSYLLRKLRSFGVGGHVLESVYCCLVESVLFQHSNLVWKSVS